MAIVDAANPGVPQILAKGTGVLWLNPMELVVIRDTAGQYQTSIVPIDGGPARIFGVDTTVLIPVAKANYALSIPRRVDRTVRIVPVRDGIPDWSHPQTMTPEIISGVAFNLEANYALLHTAPGRFIKVMLLSGKREILPYKYPAFDLQSTFSISRDGRKIGYDDLKSRGNLVMIENLR